MKFSFRPYKGDKGTSAEDSSESAPSKALKRREQIRKAQKTHRERKEAYITSLEAEVIQLRANEARILQETKNLYSEVSTLKSLLQSNGIAIPWQPAIIRPPSLALSPSWSNYGGQLTLSCGDRERKGKNRRRQICVQEASHPLPTPSHNVRLGDLDPTVLGLEFVLTLESPCLPHIDVPRDPSNHDANGHSLTVSACLLHHRPHVSEPRRESSGPWQVPDKGIERLLELSEEIVVEDDEVTPVQAWDILRKHEEFATLELSRLEDLKDKLVAWVKCYGFGGVILRAVLENAIFEAFVVGRVF